MPYKGLDKDWRFKKDNKPDPGTYDTLEPALTKSSTIKRPQSAKFSNKENKRFTTLYAEAHAYVPGPGTNDIE